MKRINLTFIICLISFFIISCKKESFVNSQLQATSRNGTNDDPIHFTSSFEGLDDCGIKYSDSTMRVLRHLDISKPISQGATDSLSKYTNGRLFGCKYKPDAPTAVSPEPWTPVPVDVNKVFYSPSQIFELLSFIPVGNGAGDGRFAIINAYKQSLLNSPNSVTPLQRSLEIVNQLSILGYNDIHTITYPYNGPADMYRNGIILSALNFLTGSSPIPANVYNDNFLIPGELPISHPSITEIGWIKIFKNHESDPDPIIQTPTTSQIPGIGINIFEYGDELGRMENYLNGAEATLVNTMIYFDNNKYYHDASKTLLLPTGWYTANYTNIYLINSGSLVETKTLTPCSTCPMNVLPPMLNPF